MLTANCVICKAEGDEVDNRIIPVGLGTGTRAGVNDIPGGMVVKEVFLPKLLASLPLGGGSGAGTWCPTKGWALDVGTETTDIKGSTCC
jgi:hypothetical protein